MSLCRTSEASVPADEACQGGVLGLVPTPRVCSLDWQGHALSLCLCPLPGEVAPVVCTAHEPGSGGIPATRESTATPKGTIPAPSRI